MDTQQQQEYEEEDQQQHQQQHYDQLQNQSASEGNSSAALAMLNGIDKLKVKQQVEMLEALIGWEGNNKYQVMDGNGQPMLLAVENSGALARQLCGAHRGFEISIVDNSGKQVMMVRREFKICTTFGWACMAGIDCCANEIVVEAPVGQVVGQIRQRASCGKPRYFIRDAAGEDQLCIEGPVCLCDGPCCPRKQKFKVLTKDMSKEVGEVSKKYGGLLKEAFTDADNFSISFPKDLDVKVKATMLGAVFLIDFMYFEKSGSSD